MVPIRQVGYNGVPVTGPEGSMAYRLNPIVEAVAEPPVAEVHDWIRGRDFPADRPLLDVCQAVPSYPPAPALQAHIAGRAGEDRTSVYTDIIGLAELRAALATHMSADYDGRIEAAQVAVTAGCNQAFCLAMTALAAPGDEVILPVPYYFNHHMWLEMQGVRPVFLPFDERRGGIPDPAAAAERIGGRTRAIVLVTPNNPTGAEYPPEAMEAFYRLARDKGIALVVDETYKDFRSGDSPPHGLFRHHDWPRTLVHLYSFSKVFSLTGYRVGSAICGDHLIAGIAKLADCVAICAPHIGQQAALFGLLNLDRWKREKRRMMGERVATLSREFLDNRLGYRLVTAGAYFAYVRHPFAGQPAAAVARRLADEHNLLAMPGSMFGPDQEDYLRFAFANLEAQRMPELVRRLIASQE